MPSQAANRSFGGFIVSLIAVIALAVLSVVFKWSTVLSVLTWTVVCFAVYVGVYMIVTGKEPFQ